MHPLVKPLGGVLGSSAASTSPLFGVVERSIPAQECQSNVSGKAFTRLRTVWQSSE